MPINGYGELVPLASDKSVIKTLTRQVVFLAIQLLNARSTAIMRFTWKLHLRYKKRLYLFSWPPL